MTTLEENAGPVNDPTTDYNIFDPEFTASINRLNSLIEQGIPAFISFDHLRETTNQVNQIEAEVSK